MISVWLLRCIHNLVLKISFEHNLQQVIVGLDTADLLSDMGVSSPSEIDFGFDEIDDDYSGVDDEGEDEGEED